MTAEFVNASLIYANLANECGAMRNSRSESADHIKAVALRLFAERGTDGVTVRQIAEAAGQKNHASLSYHFGSKEALIRELIIDGARIIDDQRNAWLDHAEAAGGPDSVAAVMDCLVRTSLTTDPAYIGECYNRFIVDIQRSKRAMVMDALGGHWNSGYLRCFHHIRRLLPSIPEKQLNQRLVFLGAALGGILAARETELADQSRAHTMWSQDATLTNIAHALAAMVVQQDGVDTVGSAYGVSAA